MKIRVGTLRKLIRETLYKGRQMKGGKLIDPGSTANADDPQQAAELIAKKLEKMTGKPVDPLTIDVEEVDVMARGNQHHKVKDLQVDYPDAWKKWIKKVRHDAEYDRDMSDPMDRIDADNYEQQTRQDADDMPYVVGNDGSIIFEVPEGSGEMLHHIRPGPYDPDIQPNDAVEFEWTDDGVLERLGIDKADLTRDDPEIT